MSKTFKASADIPGSSPNIEIDLRKDKTKERDPGMFSKDTDYAPTGLCGSKHAVWIGIQPPPVGGPNKIIPFKNNIVVAFWANDTSGGGILDPGAIIGGIGTLITDPEEYRTTIDTGLIAVIDNAKNCDGKWDCTKEWTQAITYGVLYEGIGKPLSDLSSATGKGVSWIGKKTGWWGAESYKADEDFFGMDYHSAAADFHKVSIEVTCRQNGKTRVVHDTELSGTSAIYGGNKPKPALAYFVIDSPGEWKVRVKSVASGGCVDPRLDIIETFTVADPSKNSASSAENHARQIIGPSGKSIKVSPTAIVMAESQTADNSKFNLSPPLVGIAASALYYVLYRWWTKGEREQLNK
jgi:hypothetical protein